MTYWRKTAQDAIAGGCNLPVKYGAIISPVAPFAPLPKGATPERCLHFEPRFPQRGFFYAPSMARSAVTNAMWPGLLIQR
jgi:hypothetical protein